MEVTAASAAGTGGTAWVGGAAKALPGVYALVGTGEAPGGAGTGADGSVLLFINFISWESLPRVDSPFPLGAAELARASFSALMSKTSGAGECGDERGYWVLVRWRGAVWVA
jgi:hypothetical protein